MKETNRTHRVLRLLRLLVRRARALHALTGELGVTERTLFRDLAALRGAGFRVTQENGRYRVLVPVSTQKKSPRRRRL